MKTITLKQAVQGLEVAKASRYNTYMFNNDREQLEDLIKSDFTVLELVDTNTTEAQTYEVRGSSLKETIIAIDLEGKIQLINATSTSYNGENQVNMTIQELTLWGLKSLNNKIEGSNFEELYNVYLQMSGYEISVEDIKELGVFNSEYNVTTLSFETDTHKHWLTVNSLNQLSSVKSKELNSGRQVNSGTSRNVPTSVLG